MTILIWVYILKSYNKMKLIRGGVLLLLLSFSLFSSQTFSSSVVANLEETVEVHGK